MQPSTPQIALEELEHKLSEFFSGVDSVTVAYLFGSVVRREANGLSDIDIAVLFDENIIEKEAFDLQMELIGELGLLLKTNNIDLVVLNESPLLLSYNVIRDGIILKSDERKRVLFETRIMSKYLDRDYYVKRHMKMTLERMAKGRFRWDRK
ncbi:type VII toxin-antitoxin system MntA family adenylyltransferase antitoxin [Methanosarcina sp. Mfa9]|uniref:type VII toxin-antitoxin system MntA family adenylyltransferase antitoxin n=1 Tax=Methanosarcina sp. Mfa9 TaxID=3439063 RepID=UPI003F870BF9